MESLITKEARVTGAVHSAEPHLSALAPVVLVVEDNEINWVVAKALLAQRGIRSVLARDGLEAVRMTAEQEYAAVLMDCQMPALDGYDATARIRATECDRRVPIIAMTAYTAPGDRERCLAAGMDDYLSKPVRVDDLAAIIGRWIPAAAHERASGYGAIGNGSLP